MKRKIPVLKLYYSRLVYTAATLEKNKLSSYNPRQSTDPAKGRYDDTSMIISDSLIVQDYRFIFFSKSHADMAHFPKVTGGQFSLKNLEVQSLNSYKPAVTVVLNVLYLCLYM